MSTASWIGFISIARTLLATSISLASAFAHAQTDRPMTRAEHLACGAVALAGFVMASDVEKASARRVFDFFLVSASALDTANGVHDAAGLANQAMYRGSREWMDSMLGKGRGDAEKQAALERFKGEMTRCVGVVQAHDRGIMESRP
jgi:hypothetical protein